MITINNASELDKGSFLFKSMYCDQYMEVSTDIALIAGDVFRFIFDFYDDNNNLIGRFKTFAHDFPNGVFNVSKIASTLFEQQGFNQMQNVNFMPIINFKARKKSNVIVYFRVDVGEELNNVETLALASLQCRLCNGVINVNNPLSESGNVLDNSLAWLWALPNNRKFYISDNSLTYIPYIQTLDLGNSSTEPINQTPISEDGNATGASNTLLILLESKTSAYYVGSLSKTNQRLTPQIFPLAPVDVYKCEPFTELYFLNSYGVYEQYVFFYAKEKTSVQRSTIRTKDIFYNSNPISNRTYDKAFNTSTERVLSVSKVLDGLQDYDSFVELINSPLVYWVNQNKKVIPAMVKVNTSDGYVPRYDQAMQVSLEIEILKSNTWS
jgi:hypothetical protein